MERARARRFINMIPANIQGLSFARTPQMNINILTIGNPDGVGAFFPKARRRRALAVCLDPVLCARACALSEVLLLRACTCPVVLV